MAEESKKTKKKPQRSGFVYATGELSAAEAFDRVCDLRSDRDERRAAAVKAFEAEEQRREAHLRGRVLEANRRRFDAMLEAEAPAPESARLVGAARGAEA
jgi:hypothetical protein